MPVFVVLQREAPDWPIPLRAVVALAITAALTAASYRWVERPVMHLRHGGRTAAIATEPAAPDETSPAPEGLVPPPAPAPAPAEI